MYLFEFELVPPVLSAAFDQNLTVCGVASSASGAHRVMIIAIWRKKMQKKQEKHGYLPSFKLIFLELMMVTN